jgi:hypothetical protein
MWAFKTDITHFTNISSTLYLKVSFFILYLYLHKIDAYLEHQSQFTDADGMAEALTSWSSWTASNVGINGLQYAEAFTAYF